MAVVRSSIRRSRSSSYTSGSNSIRRSRSGSTSSSAQSQSLLTNVLFDCVRFCHQIDRESGYAGLTAQIAFPGESHGELNYLVKKGMAECVVSRSISEFSFLSKTHLLLVAHI